MAGVALEIIIFALVHENRVQYSVLTINNILLYFYQLTNFLNIYDK